MTEATTPTRPAHTPGPWFTRELDFIPLVRGGNPEFLIADAACGRNPRDEDRANARLIAAAPELLAALEGLLTALPSATTHPAIKAARVAIASATGAAS